MIYKTNKSSIKATQFSPLEQTIRRPTRTSKNPIYEARAHIAPAVTDRKTLIISGKARCTFATSYKRVKGTEPTFILYFAPRRMFPFECRTLECIRAQANLEVLCFHVTIPNWRFYRCVCSVKLRYE